MNPGMRETIEIRLPYGRTKRIPREAAGGEMSLAHYLDEHGIPLNMRCEGRGLCRGCQVVLTDGQGGKTVRACQQKAEAVLPVVGQIQIPENSWRDHSLHGVSAFEIHADVAEKPLHESGFGVALDIGTTTLAAALWEFESNTCVGHLSRPNPQSRYGDNVVSRINYAIDHVDGLKKLQGALVRTGLMPMIRELCKTAGITMEDISGATASGNPTMLHTLAGESLNGFGKYPFKPVFLEARTIDSPLAGFSHAFPLTLLPSLGPFVGSDITVGALAAGMLHEEGPILLIDFGTNGEILLRHNGGFLATATAAGPAFEGGRLSCGAAARAGVISSIQRVDNRWEWILSGEAQGDPKGISGAAYVDFVANGRRCALLDSYGRFDRSFEGVYERRVDGEHDWTVDLGPHTHVTEADVAELLQAKAAIAGGVATLLELADIEPGELKQVLVAGGFGYHLNPSSAIRVGLLPAVDEDRIRVVGNASLGGASLLLNNPQSDALQQLINSCEVIELNQISSFEDHFTDGLSLDP